MKFIFSILFVISAVLAKNHRKLKSRSSLRPYIIGGTPITIDLAPYQVSLLHNGVHDCGGSIISEKWILTACHCAIGIKCLNQWRIRAGSSYNNCGGKLFKIRKVFIHPKCDLLNKAFDSTLIELKHKLEFDQNIQPVKLPLENEELDVGTPVNITGWGITSFFEPMPDQLMSTEVEIFDYDKCKEIYTRMGSDVICAKVEGGGKSTCKGDSGGPLVYNGTIFGITSWSEGCGHPKYPGVYSNVAYIRNWIKEVAGV